MLANNIAEVEKGRSRSELEDFKLRLRDYAHIGRKLFWQRFTSYSAIAVLASIFYDWKITALCYALIWISELYDQRVFSIGLKKKDLDTWLFY